VSHARRIGWLAVLALVSGCTYASTALRPEPRFYAAGRPDPSYYCYDCHGYRYFDPYYDWCPNYGFAFSWQRHPQLTRIYRERYVALKVRDRQLGRWRYPDGYRASRRFREPRDYDTWLNARDARAKASNPSDLEQGASTRGRKTRPRVRDDAGPRSGQRPQRIDP